MLQTTTTMQLESSAQQHRLDTTHPICVAIVSSHSLAAHHLVELVKANLNMLPVVLSDGLSNAKTFPANAPVVILIDLWGLPRPTCEYLETIGHALPGAVFLAMDRTRNQMEVAHLLRAGFSGFISHDEASYLLGRAIEVVAQKFIWTSPEVIRTYMKLTSRTAMRATTVEMLTVRESQILDLLRRRCSNKEMGDLLGISESTVKFHVSNILMKLNASNRRDLAETELFDSRSRRASEWPKDVVTSIAAENTSTPGMQKVDSFVIEKAESLVQRTRTGS
ncbi:MAG TPA: response regulator transcription factor [Candidatus Angelobacter sp.]|nr:response regulator transcription factor [Candidatus Angelobacter sp.]